jgi:hypothetical protein
MTNDKGERFYVKEAGYPSAEKEKEQDLEGMGDLNRQRQALSPGGNEILGSIIAKKLGLGVQQSAVGRDSKGNLYTVHKEIKGKLHSEVMPDSFWTTADMPWQDPSHSVDEIPTGANATHYKQDMAKMMVLDGFISNHDRHNGNYMIDAKSSRIHAIDHGYSDVGMGGERGVNPGTDDGTLSMLDRYAHTNPSDPGRIAAEKAIHQVASFTSSDIDNILKGLPNELFNKPGDREVAKSQLETKVSVYKAIGKVGLDHFNSGDEGYRSHELKSTMADQIDAIRKSMSQR